MAERKKTRCVWRLSPVAVLLICVLLGDLPSSHGDCFRDPCLNGGVCQDADNANSYTCDCQNGYRGENCEKENTKVCYMKGDGTLTMFNHETAIVAAPCKYRLADFTCGDYQVKVTAGSAVKKDGSYSPDTVWVKVVNTETVQTVKLRTSLKRIEEYEAGRVDNVWSIREGNTDFLDFSGYHTNTAALYKEAAFGISFTVTVLSVSCEAESFSSPGVPVTLCGHWSTSDEILTAKTEQYGGGTTVSDEEFLRFVMLTDTTVTQSSTCVEAAYELQGCAKKLEAAKACDNIFGDQSVAACLGGDADKYYRDCVKAVCKGDAVPGVPTC